MLQLRISYRSIFWLAVAIAALFCLVDRPEGQTLNQAPVTRVRDEGTLIGSRPYLNLVGAAVTCADDAANNEVDCTVTGGSGGANVTEKSIDLGTTGGLVFTATVTGQAWVTTSSDIVCRPFATSADGQTIETYAAAALEATASNRVAATGFDIQIYSPHGATGIFRVHCTGA